MMFKAVILAALVAHTNAQGCPEPVEGEGCSVCGEGMCVTNPDAIFSFPGQPSAPCGTLQMAGLNGGIPLSQCPFLPSLIGVCECGDSPPTDAPVAPTPAPVAPTAAPVVPPTAPGACPVVPEGGCSICGADKCVQNDDALFDFPGQPIVPCANLQQAGLDGSIPLTECGILPSLPALDACECSNPADLTPAPIEPGMTPAPVAPPTSAPVAPPTSAPVVPPTSAPVAPPTTAPVVAAPVAPTPFPIFILTPQPTPTTLLPPPVASGKMGMGMKDMGMGMGDSSDDGMSMAMKRRLTPTQGARRGQ